MAEDAEFESCYFFLSSVQALHPADGAAAVAALLRHRGGVCPALPVAAGLSVQEANCASAGEG